MMQTDDIHGKKTFSSSPIILHIVVLYISVLGCKGAIHDLTEMHVTFIRDLIRNPDLQMAKNFRNNSTGKTLTKKYFT